MVNFLRKDPSVVAPIIPTGVWPLLPALDAWKQSPGGVLDQGLIPACCCPVYLD
jgi:hypothetical protein